MQISKIEKLKSKVDKLEAKNTLLEAKKYALEVEMFNEIKDFVKKHYFPFIDSIEYSSNYFRLYNKKRNEICSLTLRGENWRDTDLTQITLGYYSTQTKSNDHTELERLIALGTVSQVIQTRSDELLKDDKEMLEDMIIVCINQAQQEIDKISKDKMGAVSGGMPGGIPGF